MRMCRLIKYAKLFFGVMICFLVVYEIGNPSYRNSSGAQDHRKFLQLFNDMQCKIYTTNDFQSRNSWKISNKCSQTVLNTMCIKSIRELESGGNKEIDVTLVTHLNHDRIFALRRLCHQWKGPISAAVFINDSEKNDVGQLEIIVQAFHELHIQYQHLSLHFVYSVKSQPIYPVNSLRSIAENFSSTSHLFMNDVDFVPSKSTYSKILDWLTKYQSQDSNKNLYVVPAFETLQDTLNFPETKEKLVEVWTEGKLDGFLFQRQAGKLKFTHGPTNFQKFKTAEEIYTVPYDKMFEPYVVVPKGSPLPNPAFVGYHWDKVFYINQLYAAGYEFHVFPDCFVIHYPHKRRKELGKEHREYFRCQEKLRDHLMPELIAEHPDINEEPLRRRYFPRFNDDQITFIKRPKFSEITSEITYSIKYPTVSDYQISSG